MLFISCPFLSQYTLFLKSLRTSRWWIVDGETTLPQPLAPFEKTAAQLGSGIFGSRETGSVCDSCAVLQPVINRKAYVTPSLLPEVDPCVYCDVVALV